MILLDTSETLARIRASLPSGSPLLAAVGKLVEESHNLPTDLVRSRGGFGELGALGDPASCDLSSGAGLLLWIGPAPAPEAACRSGGYRQLAFRVPPARYRIEYWIAGEAQLAGVEIATAAPLVLAPPDLGVPLIVRIMVVAD